MEFHCKPFAALTPEELYAVLVLRQRVFVVEQRCAYLDADGLDRLAEHVWGVDPSHPELQAVSYARIFAPGARYPAPIASLGRVVCAPELRRTGAGRAIVARSLELIEEKWGNVPVKISGQTYLERFYNSFGFVRASPNYLEDDILHVDMLRPART